MIAGILIGVLGPKHMSSSLPGHLSSSSSTFVGRPLNGVLTLCSMATSCFQKASSVSLLKVKLSAALAARELWSGLGAGIFKCNE